jgi:hypothetical protein
MILRYRAREVKELLSDAHTYAQSQCPDWRTGPLATEGYRKTFESKVEHSLKAFPGDHFVTKVKPVFTYIDTVKDKFPSSQSSGDVVRTSQDFCNK